MKKRGPKIEALVVGAIRRLQDVQGSTPREISNYIAQEYDVPGQEIRKQVQLALKRGVSYGILQRSKGGCYTCSRDFLAKQPMEGGDVEMRCRPRRARSRGCRPRKPKRSGCRPAKRASRKSRGRCGRRSSRKRSSRSACKRKRSGSKRRCSSKRSRSGCKKRRSSCKRPSRRKCGSSSKKRRRSRGKRCSSQGMAEMEEMSPKQIPRRRNESASRNESPSDGSSLSGSSDDRRMDAMREAPQSDTPPDARMD